MIAIFGILIYVAIVIGSVLYILKRKPKEGS